MIVKKTIRDWKELDFIKNELFELKVMDIYILVFNKRGFNKEEICLRMNKNIVIKKLKDWGFDIEYKPLKVIRTVKELKDACENLNLKFYINKSSIHLYKTENTTQVNWDLNNNKITTTGNREQIIEIKDLEDYGYKLDIE